MTERTSKLTATPADLTRPLDVDFSRTLLERADAQVADCFTKLWDPRATECTVCADNEVCGIQFGYRVKGAGAARMLEEGVQPLDSSDLATLPLAEVYREVWALATERAFTSADFVSYLQQRAKTDDRVALIEWIKRFIAHYRPVFKIAAGIVVVDTVNHTIYDVDNE